MRPLRVQSRKQNSAYFVSTQTVRRQPFFRHERWASLLRETILHYSDTAYSLYAYVIMPDHLHLLIAPNESLERAIQHIKGGFSFRAKRELAWKMDIWQPGFTDHCIRGEQDWHNHLGYIRCNPVKAKLVEDAESYPYMEFLNLEFPQGLKPTIPDPRQDVRAEARTLRAETPNIRTAAPTVRADLNEVYP